MDRLNAASLFCFFDNVDSHLSAAIDNLPPRQGRGYRYPLNSTTLVRPHLITSNVYAIPNINSKPPEIKIHCKNCLFKIRYVTFTVQFISGNSTAILPGARSVSGGVFFFSFFVIIFYSTRMGLSC